MYLGLTGAIAINSSLAGQPEEHGGGTRKNSGTFWERKTSICREREVAKGHWRSSEELMSTNEERFGMSTPCQGVSSSHQQAGLPDMHPCRPGGGARQRTPVVQIGR